MSKKTEKTLRNGGHKKGKVHGHECGVCAKPHRHKKDELEKEFDRYCACFTCPRCGIIMNPTEYPCGCPEL